MCFFYIRLGNDVLRVICFVICTANVVLVIFCVFLWVILCVFLFFTCSHHVNGLVYSLPVPLPIRVPNDTLPIRAVIKE